MIAAACLFCELLAKDFQRIVEENELAYAIRDGFAVTLHPTLVIPRRHMLDYFGLSESELLAMNQLLVSQKAVIENLDSTVNGFNVGANCGGRRAIHMALPLALDSQKNGGC